MPDNMSRIDEEMMSLSGMIDALMPPVTGFMDEAEGVQLTVNRIVLDMPVQLQVITDEVGMCHLGTTPPLYTVETSFPTVLHQVRCSFERVTEDAASGTII